jgi:hypothetical protein
MRAHTFFERRHVAEMVVRVGAAAMLSCVEGSLAARAQQQADRVRRIAWLMRMPVPVTGIRGSRTCW